KNGYQGNLVLYFAFTVLASVMQLIFSVCDLLVIAPIITISGAFFPMAFEEVTLASKDVVIMLCNIK
ncbi:hypothetical protein, partial [Erythrobacter sp. YJ-T3-07]|uniref:hypothetical protein n=1 Tax=Erythrobacter sp. YJ-T3-07 TaxID=2793063 RepID=UPI001F31546E